MEDTIEVAEGEVRKQELRLVEANKQLAKLYGARRNKIYREFDVELTDEQKKEFFWGWIMMHSARMFPKVKRFLGGGSNPGRDFWNFTHSRTEEERNNDRDEPREYEYHETTVLMAQVIEWGIQEAVKQLGDEKSKEHYLGDHMDELRSNVLSRVEDNRNY